MDHGEFIHGLRLAAIAALSAVVTAMVVIGVGSFWLRHSDAPSRVVQIIGLP